MPHHIFSYLYYEPNNTVNKLIIKLSDDELLEAYDLFQLSSWNKYFDQQIIRNIYEKIIEELTHRTMLNMQYK